MKTLLFAFALAFAVATPLGALGAAAPKAVSASQLPSAGAAVVAKTPAARTKLTLLAAMRAAVVSSPLLKSARFREDAQREESRAESAGYLPQLEAAAAASAGDPGSFSMLGVDANFSASQRVGGGGALILKQTLWDFGRTSSAVKASDALADAARSQNAASRADVARSTLRAYLDCSFAQAQAEDARFMARQTELIARETERFVRSGQRSVIERYLVDAEAKEAQTRAAEFDARTQVAERRLAVQAGLGADAAVGCADLFDLEPGLAELERGRGGSIPAIEAQRFRVRAAEARLERARAEGRPQIVGIASGGYWATDRIKDDHLNYAAGVGISVPLFEGFRVDAGVARAQAGAGAEAASLAFAEQSLEDAAARFDEQIRGLDVRLEFLKKEIGLARQAFDLAKKRYLAAQGTMTDLRETIRNMRRVMDSIALASHDLLAARGDRALAVDGASIPE